MGERPRQEVINRLFEVRQNREVGNQLILSSESPDAQTWCFFAVFVNKLITALELDPPVYPGIGH